MDPEKRVRRSKEDVYHTIRRGLAEGQWKSGSHLTTQQLAKELGVSRTPVREAIALLERDGLVEQIRNVGAFVRPITVDDWLEAHDVREPLETLAAGRAARRATPAQIATLRACCDAYERVIRETRKRGGKLRSEELVARVEAADMLFDHTIMEAAGNRQAVKIVDDLHRLAILLRSALPDPSEFMTVEEALQQHREIAEAIAARKPKAAKRAMRNHMRFAKRRHLAARRSPVPRDATPT